MSSHYRYIAKVVYYFEQVIKDGYLRHEEILPARQGLREMVREKQAQRIFRCSPRRRFCFLAI